MAKVKAPNTEQLFDAGVHYGHQVKRWHPNMEPYIYSVRKNVHIINLEHTEKMLKKAAEFLFETAADGGQIVFVGTKRQARDIVKLEAKRCGAKYVTERWLGGTITNHRVIKKNIDKLVNMMRQREEGEFQKYTKRERLELDRTIEKLEKSVGGIVGLNGVPAAVFVVDARREKTAISESNRAKVPVVSLIDTNSNPVGVDHPIPGNDDAIKSVALIVKTVADAIEEGYIEFGKRGKKKAAEEKAAAEKAEKEAAEAKAKAKAEKEADEAKSKAKAEKKEESKKDTKKASKKKTASRSSKKSKKEKK